MAEDVPLAGLTTLGVGGPARFFARCRSAGSLAEVLDGARSRALPIFLLGGGSNLLASDAGFPGVVIQLADESIELVDEGSGSVRVRAAAGVEWDALVARTVAEGLAGLECLSGIPGKVGAAPIQNVGAYGQEVAETIRAVEVVKLETGERRVIAGGHCGFAYRHSHFKSRWRGRYAVVGVEFLLRRQRWGTVRYAELRRRFGSSRPGLGEVRQTVLAVRRSKSMVLDRGDPNRRSAGSFFVNPVLSPDEAAEIRSRCPGLTGRPMPQFPAAGGRASAGRASAGRASAGRASAGRVKLSAAWLIEEAGFRRGERLGRAGISTRHSLALVNRGGATAAEIVALAAKIRRRVRQVSGVTLEPEPVFLGFKEDVATLLG